MKLTLPYPPSTNVMYRNYRGVTVTSGEAAAYKIEAGYLARQQGVELLHGPVKASLDFYRPQRSGDLDNRLKCTLDALNGIAWADDGQIVEIHARRFDDAKNPRVELVIESA